MNTSFIESKTKERDLIRRRELTSDLMFVVKEDNSVLEQILDDYVYRLSDNEVSEYEVLVGSILDEDQRDPNGIESVVDSDYDENGIFIDINNNGGQF
tara:strand:+ start:2764 stop:3057 length:294 start_codon:yes stop_codon:yes gene_type:complete